MDLHRRLAAGIGRSRIMPEVASELAALLNGPVSVRVSFLVREGTMASTSNLLESENVKIALCDAGLCNTARAVREDDRGQAPGAFVADELRRSAEEHDCPAHPHEEGVTVWDIPIAARNGGWIYLPNHQLHSGRSSLRTRGLLSVGWRHSEQVDERRMERRLVSAATLADQLAESLQLYLPSMIADITTFFLPPSLQLPLPPPPCAPAIHTPDDPDDSSTPLFSHAVQPSCAEEPDTSIAPLVSPAVLGFHAEEPDASVVPLFSPALLAFCAEEPDASVAPLFSPAVLAFRAEEPDASGAPLFSPAVQSCSRDETDAVCAMITPRPVPAPCPDAPLPDNTRHHPGVTPGFTQHSRTSSDYPHGDAASGRRPPLPACPTEPPGVSAARFLAPESPHGDRVLPGASTRDRMQCGGGGGRTRRGGVGVCQGGIPWDKLHDDVCPGKAVRGFVDCPVSLVVAVLLLGFIRVCLETSLAGPLAGLLDLGPGGESMKLLERIFPQASIAIRYLTYALACAIPLIAIRSNRGRFHGGPILIDALRMLVT